MEIRMKTAVLCLCVAFLAAPGLGAIIYVDADAPGANDGTSWVNAFRDLQDALAKAGAGDEIRVAQGVYRPDKGAGDRKATFQLKSGVKVYGGYAGDGQPDPQSRDLKAYPSILSGDLLGNDGPLGLNSGAVIRNLLADESRQDNAYAVVTASGADANALLSGFTITQGVASAAQWPVLYSGRGAGLYLLSGSPSIEDCTFRDNLSAEGGAGVACHQASPSLVRCTFTHNFSLRSGGAMSNWGRPTNVFGVASDQPITVSQCLFSENRSDDNREDQLGSFVNGYGGAVYNYDSHLVVTGSTFQGNGGCFVGGALCNDSSSEADIVDCNFIANLARDRGGAVYNFRGSVLTLTRCLFLRNMASGEGAAVQSTEAAATVAQCRFHGNSALVGGAISTTDSEATILNSLFTGNIAWDLGGALAINSSEAEVVQCTFTGNTAPEGAAIGLDSSNPPDSQSSFGLYNSILWDGGSEIASRDGTVGAVVYNDIFDELGAWTFFPTNHNQSVDPRFVDASGPDGLIGTEDDNVRLAVGSPCIDAGSNARVPAGTLVDLDGKSRFADDPATADTGLGEPPIVDLGAYEFIPIP